MKRFMMFATFIVASIGLLASFAGAAVTNTTGPINFSSPYAVGPIAGQPGDTDPLNNWSNDGGYDANVALVSGFPAGSAYASFGDQALQISNTKASGSFGDQVFSPSVIPAVKGTTLHKFDSTFSIGTTTIAQQSGLSMSVSPDNRSGARMSYLRFDDQSDGVHVFFDQARGATFKESDIATLTRGTPHTIGFSIDFSLAPSKAVTITIDSTVKATGSTWESYYQTQEHNPTPSTSTMLFRTTTVSANAGNGFLIDNLTLTSS
jgi:hypothetical protein